VKIAKRLSAPASIALAFLITAAPSAFAMTMPAASNSTKILINPTRCDIGGYAPGDDFDYELHGNPDTVTVPFDIDWEDKRSGVNPPATHYYSLQTVHSGSGQFTDHTELTRGGEQGGDTISLDVTNVYDGDYIDIWYNVSLSLPGGQDCPADGSFHGHYHFIYP
jgi:hypothetical protein